MPEGRFLRITGISVERRRFRADTAYREQNVLPAVRAPHEGIRCLERLAAIAVRP